MSDVLSMWTIYDKPTDHPYAFVARRFEVGTAGVVATDNIIIASQVETLRECMRDRGLTCLERDPLDDPKIVEVWL